MPPVDQKMQSMIASRVCLPNETLDEVDPMLWSTDSDEFLKLHPPLINSNDNSDATNEFWECDEEQTYSDFVEMANREPNEEGTGRFVLTRARRKIGLLDLTTRKRNKNTTKKDKSGRGTKRMKLREDRTSRIATFLEMFLGLKVDIRHGSDEGLKVRADKKGGGICIEDHQRMLSFPLHTLQNNNGTRLADVFSIFDVAVEYVQPSEFCLLILTNVPLGEELGADENNCGEEADEVQEVLGRACGNRVAVVHCNNEADFTNEIELFGTAAHELLHTMGLDHTTFWRCLMNPSTVDGKEWFFLSPHNLRKLANFLGEVENSHFVLDRYLQLLDKWWQVFDENCVDANASHDWLKRKVSILQKKHVPRQRKIVTSR